MNKRATLKDVAREAGVTAATVSYVVNNTPGQTVRPETRDRVLAAVAKLNYIPNTHAQTLKSSCIPCVGVVIRKNLAVPRFAQMVFGIQERLEQEGCNALLLGNAVDGRGFTDYVGAYLAGRVSGIIFIGTENMGPDKKSLELLQAERAPLVVFNCQTEGDFYSTVDLDYRGGARLITSRVLARGCHRVLYFRPDADTPQERLREQGVRDAVEGRSDVELIVRSAPIALDSIEVWDARYYAGDTDEGLRLNEVFMESAREALALVEDGDAVIASWSTWTHYFRKAEPTRDIVYAELANNGESWVASDLYTRMPNYDAGVACADEILSLVNGGACCARTIKLANVFEARQP